MSIKIVPVLMFSAILLAMAVSCKKDEEATILPPTITRVAEPLNRAADLKNGSLASWLIIYGSHLSTAQEVKINGELIDPNDFYATDSSVTLQVPRRVPSNATGKITVTTKAGTATYDFTIAIPEMLVSGMLNEWTPEGDTLVIMGQNFDLYGATKDSAKITFTGGANGKVTFADATTLKAVVPAGALVGKVTIRGFASLGNLAVKQTTGWYKDNRNMIVEMNPYNGSAATKLLITNGPAPAPLNGNYIRMNKTIGNFAYTEFVAQNMALGIPVGSAAGYLFKFETFTTRPMAIMTIKFDIGGATPLYVWKPFATGAPFNTNGKWQTISIPMEQIIANVVTPIPYCKFIYHGSGPETVDMSFCNFRIVPKN